MSELTKLSLEKAQEVLARECSPLGLMASPEGYPHVWARDSVITSLGAILTPGHEACLRTSLRTLAGQQSELGAIPNNVSVATGRLDHTNAGSVDSNLWYIIGHYIQWRTSGDFDFLQAHWPSLEQALLWLRYQDSNSCGLLEVHEAADWADLLANRFNILYDNVLWYAALRAMASLADSLGEDGTHYAEMASDVRHKLRIVLWVGPENADEWGPTCPSHTEWKHTLSQVDPVLVKRPFFLPYVAFRDYGDYCDVFGNLLAVLFGVANPAQEKRILDYLYQVGIAEPYPVRVLHPPIYPGSKDWREYYRNNNLNLPDQYHNGGIWPFVGGFYVAVLVKTGRLDEAQHQLEKLAEVNRLGINEEWEFNEWCHGRTGRPMGYPHQAWSAGMYIYAHRGVAEGRVPVFDVDW
ncbi:MAG: GH116 family glycosyl hydrolase [Anaerolineae bacterium]|jgi:glycogen debranching enzyme|nr:GH116 family glycosyl hydrolase [Anaerolineae bacterium]MDH7474950.1 amylo-alpha-1,6-glucosidase [Anaerolineae bacterium]